MRAGGFNPPVAIAAKTRTNRKKGDETDLTAGDAEGRRGRAAAPSDCVSHQGEERQDGATKRNRFPDEILAAFILSVIKSK
jgi:hypothetical protein